MASIGVLGADGSGGPSWQVDIPGLTQLILSAGTYGLKQLASAGIDMHTIGCILMLSEYTPASKEFRKTINRAREQQRSQRLWMYKMVEIGTATNFLADQLLKTRAGENVLALMAATSSITDEDSCVSAIAALFEGAKVSADNIPGTGQLRSLRNGLCPLGRMTGFGEKLLRYHQFLKNISFDPTSDPYASIPGPSDVAGLIRMLHKICSAEEHYVLRYDGFLGAAWVVTYGCEILGLSACAINGRSGSEEAVPINGSYEEAKIIVNLAASTNAYTLYLEKDVHEIINVTGPLDRAPRGWNIDCSKENFLLYRHPKIDESPSFDALSIFTAIATLNRASQIACTLGIWTSPAKQDNRLGTSGLLLYSKSSLPSIHERCLRILRTLGFRRGDLSRFITQISGDGAGHRFVGHQSVLNCHGENVPVRSELFDRGFDSTIDIFNCLKVFIWTVDGNIEGHQSHEHNPEFRNCRCHAVRNHGGLSRSAASAFLDWALGLRNEIGQTVADAVDFASLLAFTNWDSSLRLMSVRFFELGDTSPLESSESAVKDYMLKTMALCTDNVHSKDMLQRDWQEDWLAMDIDGMIMLRNSCFIKPIHKISGQLLTFSPGRMLYEGTPCFRLRADAVESKYKDFFKEFATGSILPPILRPSNEYPSMSVRHFFSKHRGDIFVRSEIYDGSQLCYVPDATIMESALLNTFITAPCPHGYFGNELSNAGVVIPSHIGTVIEGLVFSCNSPWMEAQPTTQPTHATVFYQCTHDNELAQWLACHWQSQDKNKTSIRVLQLDCCTGCVLDRVNALIKLNPQINRVCVIAGGNGPEIDDPQTSLEGIRQALKDAATSSVLSSRMKKINQEAKQKMSRRPHLKSLLKRSRTPIEATTTLLDLQAGHAHTRDDTSVPMQAIGCAVVTTSKHGHSADRTPAVEIQSAPKSSLEKATFLSLEPSDVVTIFAPLSEQFCWARNERNKVEGIAPLSCLSILGDGVGFEQVVAESDYEDVHRLSRALFSNSSSLPGLPFKKGDNIWLYERIDSASGWGRNIRTGNEGVFHLSYTRPQTAPEAKPYVAIPEEFRPSTKTRQSFSENWIVFSFGKDRILRRGPRREHFKIESRSRYALVS